MPVQQRMGLRVVIAEKFAEVFNWYEQDLDEIEALYQANKVHLFSFFVNASFIINMACLKPVT